jgi:hypothetical protein
MIDQVPLYLFCYFIGWVPLYFLYRQLESRLPFHLKKSNVLFSWFPFFYGLYMVAEIGRGYALMHIVHQWLTFDIDLIIGAGIWFLSIGFPVFISSKHRTSLWLSMMGVYLYLLPTYVWLMPVVMILCFFMGKSRPFAYAVVGALFLMIGVLSGGNSLYILLYLSLLAHLIVKSVLDEKHAKI